MVFTGASKFVHASGQKNEGVFNFDHSGENVYQLDFTEFKTPGKFFISVAGVGRSHAFEIAGDVYRKARDIQAHGMFTARCGIEFGPPHSPWTRVACHTNGVFLSTRPKRDGEFINPSFIIMRPGDGKRPALAEKLDKDPALVGWWPLDNTARDASGRGNDLALNSNAIFSRAADLTPAGRHVFGPTKADNNGATGDVPLNISNGATLCGWYKKNNTIKFGNALFGLPGNNNPGFTLHASWGVIMGNAGGAELRYIRLAPDVWHHLALVIPAEGAAQKKLQLFHNGKLAATSPNDIPHFTLSGGFKIGTLADDDAAGAFFHDVRLFERALDPAELEALAFLPLAEVPAKIPARGGHHDAGDYNPRSHIDVAQKLMDVYEVAPKKFKDNQFNIPESGNGFPDVLDEAFWALRLWIDLQDDADGGVYNGTESNGDPNFIETVELDKLLDITYAKDAAGSYTFAGAFAQASRIWKSLGKEKEAADFLTRARRAYAYAEKNPDPLNANQYGMHYLSPKAYAAAQLLKTTGEAEFKEAFADVCVMAKQPNGELDAWQKYDQNQAAFAYATAPREYVDPALQDRLRAAIIRKADIFIQHSSTMAYGFFRHPWAPITWGTGATAQWLPIVIWAHHLTGDEKYLTWIVRTCDNILGANPMGLGYVTGIGSRTVRAPLHNSRYSARGEVIDGFNVQGPHQAGEGYNVRETTFPPIITDFATLYTFVDAHFAIAMDEGVAGQLADNLAAFSYLMPDAE